MVTTWISLGDLHFGASAMRRSHSDVVSRLEYELENVFMKYLERNRDEVDGVVIDGDYFDKELSANSDALHGAIWFMHSLVELCGEWGIQVRMMRGTLSHDYMQQRIFAPLIGNVFELVEDCRVETFKLWEGRSLKVLYIPEEYPKDMRDHYRELVFDAPDAEYDMVFLHGTMRFAAWADQIIESEKSHHSAPVWREDDLARICRGPILAGHIHSAISHGSKFFYHGSFSRFAFGEEGPKGFNVAQYNMDTGKYMVTHVENDVAPDMSTWSFSKELEKAGSVEKLLEKASEQVERMRSHKVGDRLRISVDMDAANANRDALNIVSGWVSERRDVKLHLTGKREEAPIEAVSEDEKAEDGGYGRHAYLAEGHSDMVGTIRRFVKEEYGEDLSEAEVLEAVTTESGD